MGWNYFIKNVIYFRRVLEYYGTCRLLARVANYSDSPALVDYIHLCHLSLLLNPKATSNYIGCIGCSKLPDAMAGVAEQVNKEVNKSLAEREYPTMKPEHQQLLKGQIGAIIESDNAIHKLMSKWHYKFFFFLAGTMTKCTFYSNMLPKFQCMRSSHK